MEIYASHQSTDVECKSRKGQYVNDSDYDLLLTSDCDVYDSETKKLF